MMAEKDAEASGGGSEWKERASDRFLRHHTILRTIL